MCGSKIPASATDGACKIAWCELGSLTRGRGETKHANIRLARTDATTDRILFDFAELVSQLYGTDTSWDYAAEHSPFAGDWR